MGRNIAVAHFGEIIGKNHWKDFNNVWIIASPNIPVEVYPLYWCFFAQEPIGDESLLLKTPDGSFGFRENKFEEIRIGCLVSDIYQAIKRIDREVKKQSQVYVAVLNDEVVSQVRNQLENVMVGETIELDVEYKDGKKAKEPRITKARQMMSLLSKIGPRLYQKSELYSSLGWNPNSKTGRVWDDPEIRQMESAGIIKIGHSTVIKNDTTLGTGLQSNLFLGLRPSSRLSFPLRSKSKQME